MSYYDDTLERMRNALINNALNMAGHNHTRAAALLGIKRTRLVNILRKRQHDQMDEFKKREAIELIK